MVAINEFSAVSRWEDDGGPSHERQAMPSHASRMIPVVEPLCKATGQLFEPIGLYPNDRLVIRLDDDGTKFYTRAIATGPDGTYDLLPGKSRTASHSASTVWQKRIPERKENGYGHWILAATDFTALVIYHTWPRSQIIFENEAARLKYEVLIGTFLSQSVVAHMRANFKVHRIVPPAPADWVDHPELPLGDFQQVALFSTLGQESAALYMQMGTGKTAVSVARICLEAARTRSGRMGKPRMMRVLIICPRQVRLNWKLEIERFAVVPGKVTTLRGGEIGRTKCLLEGVRGEDDCAFGAVICGYESAVNTWEAIRRVPWDLVIVDEAHYLKNKWTKRFKTLIKLREISARRMILTGSPISNSVMDLWSQLEFLGQGYSGFNRFENFRAFHGKWKAIGEGVAKLIGLKNVPLIQERLARLAFMITKDEARLNLPDKVLDVYEVEMTKLQAEFYKKLQKSLRIEITMALEQAEKSGKSSMTVEHVLTMLLRLAQITSGFVKTDTTVDLDTETLTAGKVVQIPGGNPKIQALVEMLQDPERDPKGKTIVWAVFREDIRAITDQLSNLGINFRQYHGGVKDADREKAVQDFNNDPTCRVFVANAKTAGEGLNLLGYDKLNPDKSDTYVDHEIFFSQGWSSIERTQAEDRAHRRGTRCPSLRITDLVVSGTIDEEIRARVVGKINAAMQIQDIRSVMQRVLDPEAEFDSSEPGSNADEGEVQEIEGSHK